MNYLRQLKAVLTLNNILILNTINHFIKLKKLRNVTQWMCSLVPRCQVLPKSVINVKLNYF